MISWVSSRPNVDARQRQREPGQHEPDGVGQAEPARDDRDDHRDAEQRDRAGEQAFHARFSRAKRGGQLREGA